MKSIRSEAVLDLGRKLVQALELDKSVDTLGRWMAHYLAERMHAAETASEQERPAKQQECEEAILKLWEHRYELPTGSRPFEEFEPILRALESLDPENNSPRYFRPARPTAADSTRESERTREWLDIAEGLDYSAKVLISYCLINAAETTLDKSQEWVALAEKATVRDAFDVVIIRRLVTESDLANKPDLNEGLRKQLQDRLNRLEAFQSMSGAFVRDIRRKLADLSSDEGNGFHNAI